MSVQTWCISWCFISVSDFCCTSLTVWMSLFKNCNYNKHPDSLKNIVKHLVTDLTVVISIRRLQTEEKKYVTPLGFKPTSPASVVSDLPTVLDSAVLNPLRLALPPLCHLCWWERQRQVCAGLHGAWKLQNARDTLHCMPGLWKQSP